MAFRLNREVEDLFITKILEKRELHHLDREFMLGKISLYCEKNQKACRKFAETPLTRIKKAKFAEDLVRFVRKEAHVCYGMYLTKTIVKAPQIVHDLEKLAKQSAVHVVNKDKLSFLHHQLLLLHL